MTITIFAGKGGVGKSTMACAYALHSAERRSTLLIDYDGGHSVLRTLGIEALTSNEVHRGKVVGSPKLAIGVIDQPIYVPIEDAQKNGMPIGDYLAQFKEDYGIIPWCDMITTFFGAPTDIATLSRFATLSLFLNNPVYENHDIILDVEPTAGLERLLNCAAATARSLTNLQNTGWMKQQVLGVTWPDIASYLRSEYIKRDGASYALRLTETVEAMQEANFVLVCVPEPSPVDELFNVKRIVEKSGGSVKGFIINNVRRESHETAPTVRVRDIGKPVITIDHSRTLYLDVDSRRTYLKHMGDLIADSKLGRSLD